MKNPPAAFPVQAEGAGRSWGATGGVERGHPKQAEQRDQRAVQTGAHAPCCVLVPAAEDNKYERVCVRKSWKIGVSCHLLLPVLATSTRALQVLLQSQLTLCRTGHLQGGLGGQQQQEPPAPSKLKSSWSLTWWKPLQIHPKESKLSSWDRNLSLR